MKHRFAPLVALSLIAMAPAAWAQSSLSANVTGMRYTLIDLNPDDGIAPTLTWNGPVATSITSVGYHPLSSMGQTFIVGGGAQNNTTAFGASTSASNAWSQASTGNNALSASLNVDAGYKARASASQTGTFTLSAFTAVTFELDYALNGTIQLPDNAKPSTWGWAWFDYRYYDGEANVRLSRWDPSNSVTSATTGDGISFFSGTWDMSQTPPVYSQDPIETHARQGQVHLNFSNNTPSSLLDGVQFSSSVSVDSFPAPVPEAATWAQLSLGLLALAAVRRRALQGAKA
jgi:hypothetical protein